MVKKYRRKQISKATAKNESVYQNPSSASSAANTKSIYFPPINPSRNPTTAKTSDYYPGKYIARELKYSSLIGLFILAILLILYFTVR